MVNSKIRFLIRRLRRSVALQDGIQIPWSRTILDKLEVAQLVKFLFFYGEGSFRPGGGLLGCDTVQ
jgi:hypothetical protein